MMLEARYSAVFFESDQQNGLLGDAFARGVIEFRGGNIFGGDCGYHYQGTYEMVDETKFNASIRIAPHTAQSLHGSPFGPCGTTLAVRGNADHVSISCGGSTLSGSRVQIRLTKLPS